jgi:hypothetical protein
MFVVHSTNNLSMLRMVAARTLNLVLLDPAAREKNPARMYVHIVARQSSDVHRSTVAAAPLFFYALLERPNREISD